MSFYKKYSKYKTKYIDLIKQLGGSELFEQIFGDLISCCKKFNNTISNFVDYNVLMHIRGGASIKYRLKLLDYDTENITSDIDILLIIQENNQEKTDFVLKYFTKLLKEKMPHNDFQIKQNNLLYTIIINDESLIDILVYEKNIFNHLDDTNMFSYAANNTMKLNIHEYVMKLLDMIQIFGHSDDLLFTTLDFEYYSSVKGFENQNMYINKIPKWKENLAEMKKSLNPNQKMIERMERQTSDDFKRKLEIKRDRYQYKIDLIKGAIS